MCTSMDCKLALSTSVESIVQPFKNNQHLQSEKIISCFYDCYQHEFIKWASIMYKGYPIDFIEFTANTAFTDGILSFSKKAAAGEIYQDKATIRTILFGIYRNQLRKYLQTEKRISEKKEKYALNVKEDKINEEYMVREKLHLILEQAMAKMEEEDRKIIIWRHIEEKNCDEIASILDINTASATNRIYRCMNRLRKLTRNSNRTS